jgi:uncharacterized membrane protein
MKKEFLLCLVMFIISIITLFYDRYIAFAMFYSTLFAFALVVRAKNEKNKL